MSSLSVTSPPCRPNKDTQCLPQVWGADSALSYISANISQTQKKKCLSGSFLIKEEEPRSREEY